jgi:hypothetical protein
MQVSGVVDGLPFWVLFIGTVAIILLSIEGGWRVGNTRRQRAEHEQEAPIGAIVGAMLGMLAFLLAFTFGMSASRFDARRQLVLQEANAIGTTYLRADMLPEPQRSEIRNQLREYATLRVARVSASLTPEVSAKAGAVHDRLWASAVAVGTQSPNSIVVGLFVQALNEMIDLDESRVTAIRNRIPDSIWFVLYFVTILTMAAMGYQFGLTGERSWAVTIFLALAFAAVILLIADLDRPQLGFVRVSQQAMIDLVNKIGTPTP